MLFSHTSSVCGIFSLRPPPESGSGAVSSLKPPMSGRISARVRSLSRRRERHPSAPPATADHADDGGHRLPSVSTLDGRAWPTIARRRRRIPAGLTGDGGLIRMRPGGSSKVAAHWLNANAPTPDAGVTGDMNPFFQNSIGGVTPMPPEGWRGSHRGVSLASPEEVAPMPPESSPREVWPDGSLSEKQQRAEAGIRTEAVRFMRPLRDTSKAPAKSDPAHKTGFINKIPLLRPYVGTPIDLVKPCGGAPPSNAPSPH